MDVLPPQPTRLVSGVSLFHLAWRGTDPFSADVLCRYYFVGHQLLTKTGDLLPTTVVAKVAELGNPNLLLTKMCELVLLDLLMHQHVGRCSNLVCNMC